ncbi:MAG: RNA polymerase sigma factor [Polyangiaceae bacterium]|nr:RNA polymerase sigma factor [Polyangiaceae bacterium]
MTTASFHFAVTDHVAGFSIPGQHLLDRLKTSDASALGAVYDEHHQAVRAFAVRLVGDRASAEDLVQEVFLTLPKAVRKFEGQSSLRTFILGIAANRARHFVRAAARRRAAAERVLSGATNETTYTPHHDLERRELADRLNRALDSLPLDQRVAFVLCDVEERSSVEAAAVLGVVEATVRTRLFHARKKLRAQLSKGVYT